MAMTSSSAVAQMWKGTYLAKVTSSPPKRYFYGKPKGNTHHI